jgi:hypothetical protein
LARQAKCGVSELLVVAKSLRQLDGLTERRARGAPIAGVRRHAKASLRGVAAQLRCADGDAGARTRFVRVQCEVALKKALNAPEKPGYSDETDRYMPAAAPLLRDADIARQRCDRRVDFGAV